MTVSLQLPIDWFKTNLSFRHIQQLFYTASVCHLPSAWSIGNCIFNIKSYSDFILSLAILCFMTCWVIMTSFLTLASAVNYSSWLRLFLKWRTEYGLISDQALKYYFLIPFSTSYLCETGFSAMLAIKNKYRSKLVLCTDLRLKLTELMPGMQNYANIK